jgi:hypothetical protein
MIDLIEIIAAIFSIKKLQSPDDFILKGKYTLFLDRNLDTSKPSGSRDLAPPLLRPAQAWFSFGSGLLRSAHSVYAPRSSQRPISPEIVNFLTRDQKAPS